MQRDRLASEVVARESPATRDSSGLASTDLLATTPPSASRVDLTPVDEATLGLLTAQLAAMTEIRRHHPDVPETVNIAAPLRPHVYAHFGSRRWEYEGEALGEICLNANHFRQGSEHALHCLLHEAVHAANDALNVKDTSRNGRYHNARFAGAAHEFGLVVVRHPEIGFTTTGLLPVAYDRYAPVLADLARTMVLFRIGYPVMRTDPDAGTEDETPTTTERPVGPRTTGYVSAICGCRTSSGSARRLRMAVGSWRVGAVVCTVCNQRFEGVIARQQ